MFELKQKKKTHFQLKIVLALVIAFSIVFAVVATAAESKHTVDIKEGDNVISVETDLTDAYEILGSQQIILDENDELDLSGFEPASGGEIVILRECKVTIVDHDQVIESVATGSVYEALEQNGVTYSRSDVVDQFISKSVSDGMVIKIANGIDLKIVENGVTKIYGVPAGSTVNQALKYAGIELGADDVVTPDVKTPVKRNMTVKITRIDYRQTTETLPLEYKTVRKNVTTIPVGETKVETNGKDGVREVTYINKYMDGIFVGKSVKVEKVVEPAVNEVILVGVKQEATTSAAKAVQATTKAQSQATTKPTTTKAATTKPATTKPATTKASTTKAAVAANAGSSVRTISNFTLPSKYTLNSSKVPTSYSKKLTGSATAYYGGTSTSTGKKPQPGYIAVDPRIIPYGTEMWIVSNDGKYVYGYAIAADTGGFIYSGTTLCDLYFNTYNECINFGRRDVTIYIL